ncbi:hypothetical protein J3E68DRAFT_416245 [Trichoderma sp. SZMC 28012]
MRSILLPDARGSISSSPSIPAKAPNKGIMCNAKFGRPINQSCRPKTEQKKMTEETKQNRWVFSCMHGAHEQCRDRDR